MGGHVSADRMQEIFDQAKNWGRWGSTDEAGSLNLVTAEHRMAVAAGIRHGETVSCSRELPVEPSAENPRPALHMMTRGGDDCLVSGLGLESTADFVGVAYHGMATSHIDALCHVFVNGQMYNGYRANEVKSTGARHNSIMCARDGVVGRGVFLDIARLRGVDWLEPGDEIDPDEFSAAEQAQGVAVSEGDILLIGTGRDARREALGAWSPREEGMAGLHAECVPWLSERNIAVLGCDGVSDAMPGSGPEGWPMPIHQCTLVAIGVHLLDNLRLDRLAAACERLQQWSFLLTVAPLQVVDGTGSPANPIAVF